MKYGHEDKKSGIALLRDVYADQFASADDIKTRYMIALHGDVIIEGHNPQQLSDYIYDLIERLHTVRDHLRRIGKKRSSTSQPTGDK